MEVAKFLAVERAERHVLPLLDVARTPVVHQHHAEDVLLRLAHRDRLAQRVALADDEGSLQLDVQLGGRAEARAARRSAPWSGRWAGAPACR